MVGLTTFGHFVQIGGRLAVMLYALHLSASAATVGVLAALFNLVNVFTSVHVGRWIDRVGSRTPMLVGSAMILLGAALGALWHALAALFIVSAVIGTFYNIIFIAQQRLAGQYGEASERVKNFSVLSLGQSVSGTLAPVLAGFAIEHAGFTETFVMFTVFAAIPVVGLVFGMLSFPQQAPAKPRTGERRKGTIALLREPRLRAMYIVAVLASGTWSMMIFLLPLYATQIGLGASTIGIIVGSFSIATVLVRMVLPWMARRLSSWQMLIGSLALSGVAMMLVPVVTGVPALMAIAAVVGFGLGLTGPISQAILHDISPPDRIGELLGLRVTILNVSHAGVPMLTGAIGTAIGVGPVFFVVAASLYAGCWVTRDQWHQKDAVGPPAH